MVHFKNLYIFEDEAFSQPLIYLSDFYKLMTENLSTFDKHRFRSDNFQLEFKRHKTGIMHLEHGKAVTVTSVLKYIFNHFDDYKVCQDLRLDIEQLIYKSQKVGGARSTLNLYILLASQELVAKQLEQHIKHIVIDDRNIPSLELDHRKTFETDSEGWERICLFENYFSIYFYNKDLKFEETLKAKWKVFESLKSLRETSKKIQETTKAVIQKRNQRKGAHKETNSIVIVAGQKHRPAVIEKQMLRRLDSVFNGAIDRIVCIDTHDSQSNNSIMVCVSIDSIEGVDFNAVASAINNFLQQHHKVNVSCIHFLSSEELKDCQRNHSVKGRFSLRVLEKGVMDELNIFFSFLPTLDKSLNDGESETCNACFSDPLPKPLNISTFDLLQEWYLDVPLDMQILLQTFINPKSKRAAGDTETFIKGKLERLYSAYDSLLNTFNCKYLGVYQRDNLIVDELSSYFFIVKTMFSSGILSSVPPAGKNIEESSSIEKNNFSEITYLSLAGKSLEENSSAATASSSEITTVPFVGRSIQDGSATATISSVKITYSLWNVRKRMEEKSSTATACSSGITTSLPTAGETIQKSLSTATTSSCGITTSLPTAGKSIEERSSTATVYSSGVSTSLQSAGDRIIQEKSSALTTSSSEIPTSLRSAGDGSIPKRSSAATTSLAEITTSLPLAGDGSIPKRSSAATTSLAGGTSSLPIAGKRNHGESVDEICFNLFTKKYTKTYGLMEGSAKKPRQTLDKASEGNASRSQHEDKPRSEDKQTLLQSELPRFDVGQPRCEIEYVNDTIDGIQNHCARSISDFENRNEANSQFPGQPLNRQTLVSDLENQNEADSQFSGQPKSNCQINTQHESKYELDSPKSLHNLQNVKEESCSTNDVAQNTFSEENIVIRDVRSSPHPMFLEKLHNDNIADPQNPSFISQTFKRPDEQNVTPFTDQNYILRHQNPFINSEELNGNKTSFCGLNLSTAKHSTFSVSNMPSSTLPIKTEHEMDVDTISNKQLNTENRNQKTEENGNTFASTLPKRFDPVLDDVAALRSSYSQEQLPCYFGARPINPVTINSGQCSANVVRREIAAQRRPNQEIKCQECVIKHDFIRRSGDGQFSQMRGSNMDNIGNKTTQHFASDYLRKLGQYVLDKTGNC